MTLTEYKRKRNFSRTPEPAPKVAAKSGWSFVIQKHAASHLHYDFRLELDGVLKSWAVPKGPHLDPTVKRLAMAVEDHPVAYGEFEGIIPQGEYGGGTVMLWDIGTWEPVGDPHDGFKKGRLKFNLHGEKLKGGWSLIKTHDSDSSKQNHWLLFKEKDDEARSGEKAEIVTLAPLSVVSNRDLEEIEMSADRVWSSKPKAKNKRVAGPSLGEATKTIKKRPTAKTSKMPAAGTKATLPGRIEVQLATLTEKAPQGDQWLHEIKFDGYRMICRMDGKKVKFISRNHQDWTEKMNPLVEAVRELPVKQAVIDGEVVVINSEGITDFQSLQNAFRDHMESQLHYYIFDLLYLNGRSVTALPLEERKALLAELLATIPSDSSLHYSDHVIGSGGQFHDEACKLGLEGCISKLRNAPYRPGRGYAWLKVKCQLKEEFVIGGYTEPSGLRVGFGAILMGYYDAEKNLKYAGKVGTGFDNKELSTLLTQFKVLEQSTSPFIDRVKKTGDIRTAHWLTPSLVAQITYGSRTREGILRHAVYSGLREDKAANDVILDKAMPVKNAIKKAALKSSAAKTLSGSAKKAAVSRQSTAPRTNKREKGVSTYDATSATFAGVRLTHPTKVLYPDSDISKLEVAAYYEKISEWILPHIAHRPLVLVRCPDGQTKECFYQKHPGVGTPDVLRQISIRESEKTQNYIVVDNVDGLIALAQVSALEIHAWGSKEDKLEKPDRLVFDMDPSPEVAWKQVVQGARHIGQFLEDLGLQSFVKTTGGKGLHLVVPIERRHDWDEVKPFCKAVADAVVTASPDQYTSNMSKAVRKNKIFLDYLRNGRGATAVVPYSLRSRPGAPVSMPLTWDELTPKIKSDYFTIHNSVRRVASSKDDPWKEISKIKQNLTGPIKALKNLGILK